ncbi:MAG: PIN domain-containing protein [Defluviitaleaceae bacterium]|nr:PIN domain-containing protein [Defluviitaleaceae bacterium]
MKEKVGHYFNLSSSEQMKAWGTGHFIFDTNVLLKLYLLTKETRDEFYSALDVLKDRIWLPHHIAYEFSTNRFAKMRETKSRYEKEINKIDKLFAEIVTSINLKDSDRELDKIKESLKRWLSKHQESNLPFKDYSDDSIANKLFELYADKTGNAFEEEELEKMQEEGQKRYDNGIPPGYKDYKKVKEGNTDTDKNLYSENNCFGDLIIWKQIMNYAKDHEVDIVFITGDEKEDWWYKISGEKMGARLELRREFSIEAKKRFIMYDLETFFHYYNKYIEHQHPDIGQIPKSVLSEISYHKSLPISNKIRYVNNLARKRRRKSYQLEKCKKCRNLQNLNRKKLEALQRLAERGGAEEYHTLIVERAENCSEIKIFLDNLSILDRIDLRETGYSKNCNGHDENT